MITVDDDPDAETTSLDHKDKTQRQNTKQFRSFFLFLLLHLFFLAVVVVVLAAAAAPVVILSLFSSNVQMHISGCPLHTLQNRKLSVQEKKEKKKRDREKTHRQRDSHNLI